MRAVAGHRGLLRPRFAVAATVLVLAFLRPDCGRIEELPQRLGAATFGLLSRGVQGVAAAGPVAAAVPMAAPAAVAAAAPVAPPAAQVPEAGPAEAPPATGAEGASGAGGGGPSAGGDAAGGADPGLPDGTPEPARTQVGPHRAERAEAGPARLGSIAHETWVLARPGWDARRLGYLRAGALVPRAERPEHFRGCQGGWFRIEPRGFVCAGPTATLDPSDPLIELTGRPPDLGSLPYPYAMARIPPPPLSARLPTAAEQQRAEPDLGYQRRRAVDHLGRRFGLTTDLELLPLDRARLVEPSAFHGVELSDELTLPLAFVRSRYARRYRPHEKLGVLMPDGILGYREAVGLTGRSRRSGGRDYLEAQGGFFVLADQAVRVDGMATAPGWASAQRRWIDVSLLRQALVAYVGTRPVFATLVSTGADGIQDHRKTHATIQGSFLIHTKHVSTTMDGDERGDEFDLRDVPFVQYFADGYALHGAYWHDDFGTPRSHGCVNLAPLDAAWLFGWTAPAVPAGWHAALSLRGGTLVHIHP
ncbi:MAG: L,D-transpeptidase [Deltaproteobacteria bacterium]|nr:L,D-transpeptidase [Deltaproteobacteria bacterium]